MLESPEYRREGNFILSLKTSRVLAWVAWGIGLTLLSAGCAQVPRQEPMDVSPLRLGENDRVVPSQVVLVFDASHSIDAASSFAPAKALIESFVAGMPDGDFDAAGVTLGQLVFPFRPLSPFERSSLADAARGLLYVGGPTPLDEALGLASGQLARRPAQEAEETALGPQEAAIVIFSDGVPTRGSTPSSTLQAARDLVANYSGQVCFHTIRTGADPSGEPLLREIAGLTQCGTIRSAAQVGDVASLERLERDVFVERREPETPPVAAAPPSPDADADGVVDAEDRCPRTPRGADVNRLGCWELEGVRFDFDSARLRPESEATLREAIDVLRANPEVRVRLDAHTDSRGSDAYNLRLSGRRAESVRAFLLAAGIDSGRLEVKGWGESRPIASNDSDEGRQANRRLEIVTLP